MDASARAAEALQSAHLNVSAMVVSRKWCPAFVGRRARLVLSELGQLQHLVDVAAREYFPDVETLVEVLGWWAGHCEAHLSGSGLGVGTAGWDGYGKGKWVDWVGADWDG